MEMNNQQLLFLSLEDLLSRYPLAGDFFDNYNLVFSDLSLPLEKALEGLDGAVLSEFGVMAAEIPALLLQFLQAVTGEMAPLESVRSLTILGGRNKAGEAEQVNLTLFAGEVVSIVGPTGSGKSRLLADIECLAQGDTPTGRRILINGQLPDESTRYQMEGKLVAQLSQNMNFVIDLTVYDFLTMHGMSRLCTSLEETVLKCFQCANELSGEKFGLETKVTQLSGGQSRALMIADTAYMSASPIILIDEIENAGIDRRKAVELLSQKEKIILISTHDPILALSGKHRLIIKNGGIDRVLETSRQENLALEKIQRLDQRLYRLREQLRRGERMEDLDWETELDNWV